MPLVRKLIDLSTAHLTKEVARQLTGNELDLPTSVKQDEYGFLIAVLPKGDSTEDQGARYPQCIQDAIKLARLHGADFILYDRDAEKIDDLPAYDW